MIINSIKNSKNSQKNSIMKFPLGNRLWKKKKSLKTYIKVQFFDVITLIIVEAIKCDNKLIMRVLEPS